MHRTWSAAGVVAGLLVWAASVPTAGVPTARPRKSTPATPTAARYSAPVTPLVVLNGFTPPSYGYGPGHRGVDLRSATGGAVRVAAAGTVTFSGQVAGRGVVVVAHVDGIRTEYEPVSPAVRRGATVSGRQVIGHVSGAHRGCSGPCLHWGARRGEVYLDPLTLLHPLGVVRLLPWESG